MARELVLDVEAVLADGTVVSSMNRMLNNNAGYDLKHLLIGTEGTLGVIYCTCCDRGVCNDRNVGFAAVGFIGVDVDSDDLESRGE